MDWADCRLSAAQASPSTKKKKVDEEALGFVVRTFKGSTIDTSFRVLFISGKPVGFLSLFPIGRIQSGSEDEKEAG